MQIANTRRNYIKNSSVGTCPYREEKGVGKKEMKSGKNRENFFGFFLSEGEMGSCELVGMKTLSFSAFGGGVGGVKVGGGKG